jgi:transglutaminase-like putative cysteine protease
MADLQKVQAIYDWVAANIAFDYDAYFAGMNRLVPASQVMQEKKGTCRDYSFLVAAMARALGIPVRVVYGQATGRGDATGAQDQVLHAWNEALVGGKWISLDATFGAGYVGGDKFVPQVSQNYFNLAAGRTHLVTTLTYH